MTGEDDAASGFSSMAAMMPDEEDEEEPIFEEDTAIGTSAGSCVDPRQRRGNAQLLPYLVSSRFSDLRRLLEEAGWPATCYNGLEHVQVAGSLKESSDQQRPGTEEAAAGNEEEQEQSEDDRDDDAGPEAPEGGEEEASPQGEQPPPRPRPARYHYSDIFLVPCPDCAVTRRICRDDYAWWLQRCTARPQTRKKQQSPCSRLSARNAVSLPQHPSAAAPRTFRNQPRRRKIAEAELCAQRPGGYRFLFGHYEHTVYDGGEQAYNFADESKAERAEVEYDARWALKGLTLHHRLELALRQAGIEIAFYKDLTKKANSQPARTGKRPCADPHKMGQEEPAFVDYSQLRLPPAKARHEFLLSDDLQEVALSPTSRQQLDAQKRAARTAQTELHQNLRAANAQRLESRTETERRLLAAYAQQQSPPAEPGPSVENKEEVVLTRDQIAAEAARLSSGLLTHALTLDLGRGAPSQRLQLTTLELDLAKITHYLRRILQTLPRVVAKWKPSAYVSCLLNAQPHRTLSLQHAMSACAQLIKVVLPCQLVRIVNPARHNGQFKKCGLTFSRYELVPDAVQGKTAFDIAEACTLSAHPPAGDWQN
eukprot:g78034.t1